MNRKILMAAAAALAAAALGACGSSSGGGSPPPVTPPPPASTAQMLDTSQLLMQARQTSETASPFAVNGGALTLTDTSDSTEPASVVGP